MRKNSLLTLVLCATLIGSSTPAFAKTGDQAYTDAYNATVKATQIRNQASINEARKAIEGLRGKADWAIGEFSKLVDQPQQKLFESFMNTLFFQGQSVYPYDSLSQKEINKARSLVIDFATYEGNKPYIDSWSSAVDRYQAMQIEKAVKVLENAEKTKKSVDIAAAKSVVNELATVENNNTVKNFATQLQTRLNRLTAVDNGGDLDPNADPMLYRNYAKFAKKENGNWSIARKVDDLTGWSYSGVADLYDHSFTYQFGSELFSFDNYYKNMSPYAGTHVVNHCFEGTEKQNYEEIVRLADGFVVERLWEDGKLETFIPPALTIQQINDYKTKSYKELVSNYKGL
jgi:hypothetical protein